MAREYVLEDFRREVDLRIDYAGELNEQQFAAATAPPGPSLVLAGAGSGKTRTLTYRVAYLLERGVPPDHVLLLTFTNKAAREMMRRVGDLLSGDLGPLWGGTFHSVGARVLRVNAKTLGFRPDFTILDRQDSEDLLKACIGELGVKGKAERLPKTEVLADVLSRAANECQPVAVILSRHWEGPTTSVETIERLHGLYVGRKKAANVMDFDDLLALWLRLLKENEEVRERYQRRFEFVLVDEYQDTNQIQSDLIDILVARHRNVMAVGDDSQSIYSWRGANFRNILEFPRRYPDARVFKIEINYRSTPEILAVANAAIAANERQFRKELAAARKPGMKPALVPSEDAQQQAAFVGQRIEQLSEEGVVLSQIAVLYRSHFHALELQLELTRRQIPFLITSGIRFFEQAHLKDVAGWLKFVTNPADEVAFKRVVTLFSGVGPKAADKLWRALQSAWTEARLKAADRPIPLAPLLMAIRPAVPRKAETAWAVFATTIAELEAPRALERPGEMIRRVVLAFYEDYVRETFANAQTRLDDLDHLAAYAAQFGSATEFLTQLSLLNSLEAEAEQRARAADDERVRLSTVHQAKGLEFQVVFVIMLADGLFPSVRSLNDADRLEEERRLFYVAVTRAKDELFLSYPLLRFSHGQGSMRLLRSRFLSEIPSDLLDEWNLRPAASFVTEPSDAEGEGDEEQTDDSPF